MKDVSGELSELTGIDNVVLLNDANAAALGEVICGTSKMLAESSGSYQGQTAVVVTIGTGIGGGVVIDGEVMQGAFGAAGEIGHMKIAPQHPLLQEIVKEDPDVIETFEDLEYYASATGIARVAKAALKVLPYDSSLKDEEVDAKAVFDAAKEGDDIVRDRSGYVHSRRRGSRGRGLPPYKAGRGVQEESLPRVKGRCRKAGCARERRRHDRVCLRAAVEKEKKNEQITEEMPSGHLFCFYKVNLYELGGMN